MKKFLYSSYTKFTAVVLVICLLVLAADIVIDTSHTYANEEYQLYRFEESFEDSYSFTGDLNTPAGYVLSTYSSYYTTKDKAGMSFEEALELSLNNIDSSMINYFISVNGTVFTNCGAESEADVAKGECYLLEKRHSDGSTEYKTSPGTNAYFPLDEIYRYNSEDEITVAASIKEDYIQNRREIWNRQAEYVKNAFINAAVVCAAALLLLIYLIAVSGKKATGEHKTMWLDSVWTELHVVNIIFSASLGIGICLIVFDMYFDNEMPFYMVKTISLFSFCVGALLVVASLLSIVRKLKCGIFLKSSIICKILCWIWRIFVKAIEKAGMAASYIVSTIKSTASKKSTLILTALLLVYTALIGLCGIFVPETGAGLMLGIALFLFAAFVLMHRGQDIDSIRKGADEIRRGNLNYKIGDIKSEDLKALADNINSIGMGLDKSVSAKLRAERLKTELITNVSHDLKTPLTSIISYTKLLSDVEGLPEEAIDYISIIEKKSERLKNLTQDLFDISKVQSGNETINSERLDISLLINQALGEHDSEIKNSDLTFCVNLNKELFVMADGRKMSRVTGNLISNALKYSMKNTRVFISAVENNGDVTIEFKNIAAYAMDFDSEEITERFVRGEESRTTEGSGLGLAIAKSYTEACGGQLRVVTDGDLFKVIITFKKA